jgi:hypothetical protein
MKRENKLKMQNLIFDKKVFPTRRVVKIWVKNNNYKLLSYKKQPIESNKTTWRARQRHPKYFKKSSFKTIILKKGVKAVKGYLNAIRK